jgi:bacteriochlorophyll 4-vinyl reductase
MVDAGIGRLLVASLHQGIADVAPTRLAFYEHWLSPPGLREAKFGLGPLHAVLSFLRREGQPAYEHVMRRAGTYTADWAYEELSPVARKAFRALPFAIRARAALMLSRRLVRRTFRGSRARTRLRRGVATMDIHASIFCTVRATSDWPTCVFYSAAVEQFLRRCDIDAVVEVSQCKAAGASGCTMNVTIRGEGLGQPAVEAA